ncbi:MAG: response regulator, partial [Verrucomicrobiota bacterium]
MANVLIIDDEAPILNLMAKACETAGHTVTAVLSEPEALAALDREAPDLMIVDLVLGDKSGMDLVRSTTQRFPDTKVVMVTGHGSVETAVEAMRLGAFDYLTKPFEVTDLLRTVNL